jgi:hypothetical protein
MPDFAIYYVPPSEHPLYPVASELIGYDLRARTEMPAHNASRAHFPDFTQAWVLDPNQYGLHMTIGHAMHFQAERLAAIESEIESILNLFDPAKPFELTPCPGAAYITIASRWSCMLRYDPNQAFMMLHALVVSRIPQFATGTPQLSKFLSGKTDPTPHGKHRLTQYFYENLLDDFYPHFTLFSPLPSDEIEAVRSSVAAVVPEPEPITVQTLCLLVRPDGENHYHIHREFSRGDHPQPLTTKKA